LRRCCCLLPTYSHWHKAPYSDKVFVWSR
jgi:hypothetical protein